MPKKQIFGSIILIVILSFVCMYIYDNFKVEKETKLIIEQGNNNNTIINYSSTKKADYYLYNIDSIIVDFSDRKLELNKALEMKQISIDDVLEFVSEKANFNDGNTILYQNDNLSVLECRFEDKTNYIFSNHTFSYRDSYCNEITYQCAFTKTYYVLDINNTKSKDDVYLTLKNNATGEVATIEIEKEKIKDLEANKYYAFKFASTNDRIDKDIRSIFEGNRILEITLVTDSTKLVNENICK